MLYCHLKWYGNDKLRRDKMKDRIDIYEKRSVDWKGAVVFPEELRKFMGMETGDKVVFMKAERKKKEDDGDIFIIELQILK